MMFSGENSRLMIADIFGIIFRILTFQDINLFIFKFSREKNGISSIPSSCKIVMIASIDGTVAPRTGTPLAIDSMGINSKAPSLSGKITYNKR